MEPLVAGPQPRVTFAVQELADEINAGAFAKADTTAFRIGRLRDDLDHFSRGGLMTVGYGKEKTCRLKRLDPGHDEVWEIRSRSPKPAIRVFGRFAMQDVFVATNKGWRDELGEENSPEWARAIRQCKVIWRQQFFTFPPLSGGSINDYISTNVVEVGRIP